MKKKLSFLIVLISISLLNAQNFNMSSTTVNVDCTTGGVLYDSGGSSGSYADTDNFVMTICPGSSGYGVFVTMDEMNIAAGDYINIYNGNSTSAPIYPDMPLDENTIYGIGAQFQSTVSNPTGCLTFEFVTNNDGTVGNFEFGLTCEPRCQEVISSIGFSDPDTVHENGSVYINLCPNDTLDISGMVTFPENNTEYTQDVSTSSFTWNWGDNSPAQTGQSQTHFYTDPGGYILNLQVEDINGCLNYQNQVVKIRVAPEAQFSALADSFICVNAIDTVTAFPDGVLTSSGQYVIGDTQFFQPPLFSGDSIFLPDGNGAGYNTSVNISSFPSSATIQDCDDILEVCINMEHSYLGDLEISLTCPNGQSAILKAYPGGGGTYLGNPIDPGTGPGSGLEYCFNPNGTTTLVTGPTQPATNSTGNTIVPGDYLPVDDFSAFVGCPINGLWTLNITDNLSIDDGYIFNWQLNIDECQYPELDSFYMVYGLGHWESNPIITGINVDSNSILVLPDTAGVYTLTYTIEDQFGCTYSNDYELTAEGFDVLATPEDTTICEGESVQLNATVVGETITCNTDYLVYEIPYYKETGTLTPFNFTNPVSGASVDVTIPFPFEFYCSSKSTLRAYPSGYISFILAGFTVPNNTTLPNAAIPSDIIALMWDELVDSSGLSGYFVTGTAPYRRLVLEFDLVHSGGTVSTEPVKGQIILHETTNAIDIICEDCQQDADDPTATQGIENFNNTFGVPTPGRDNTAWSAVNNAWRFYPTSSLNTDYTVFWTPNSTLVGDSTQAPFASPINSTEYIVSIQRNDNNCSYQDTLMVNVVPEFTYTFPNDTSICAGDSVQLSVTGNATNIAWTPSDATINDTSIFNPTVTPDSSINYYAVLDSAGFCSTLDTVMVSFIDQIIIDTTIITNPPCNGTASIEIVLDTASSPAQFSIDSGLTFQVDSFFTNLAADTYNIVVGGGGSCDTSFQVIINPSSTTINIDSIITTNETCVSSGDASIQIFATGGSGTLEYSIDSGATYTTSNLFTLLSADTFSIFVRDSLLCTVDTFSVITSPDSISVTLLDTDTATCYNDSDGALTVSASGGTGTLNYSIDNITFSVDSVFSNLTAGYYTVYVRDSMACTNSLDSIRVYEPDSLFINNIVVQNVLCFGDTTGSLITFDGQGGTAPYQYAISGTYVPTDSFINIAAGTYQLNLIDSNGCVAVPIDTAITEPTQIQFVIDTTISATCGTHNGQISLTASGGTSPYSYSLNGGTAQDSATFVNLAPGNYTITVTDTFGCDTTQSTMIDSFPPVSISLVNVDSVSCFGLSDGLIEVQASNGTSPYTFSIDSGTTYQTNATFTGLESDTFSILVRDSIGCLDTLTQIVHQPDSLGLSADIDSISCAGLQDGEISLTAVGGNPAYQFSISNDAALQASGLFTSLDSGTYTAYVVDANNCRDSLVLTVIEPDSLQITSIISTDIDCNGNNNGSFVVSVTGGTPNYSYSIDNVSYQSSSTFSNLSSGVYTIYVQDQNNCSTSQLDSIREPAPLLIDTLSVTHVLCNGGADGRIELVASGGVSPYEYSINGGTFQNDSIFNTLATGSYTAVVRDANNCTASILVVIDEPNPLQVNIDSTNILCFGDVNGNITINSITGETAPYTVSFDGGAPQLFTGTMSFDNLAAGTYSIIIEDANGCPNTAYQRNVTIETPNLFEIDNLISTNPLCFGDENGSITVQTNGGGFAPYTYSIVENGNTTTNTTGVFENLSEGDYVVIATDQNGCTDQVIDTLIAPPEIFLSVDTVFNPTCFGYANGQIIMTANGGVPIVGTQPYTFTLEDGTVAIGNVFPDLSEGVYEVTVTDANNCTKTMFVTVEDPDPVFVSITPEDTLIEMGDVVPLSVVTENAVGTEFIYEWNPSAGLSCTDCENPTVQIYDDEEFILTFYDENGCSDDASAIIRVSDSLRYYIPNAFTPSDFDNVNNTFKVYGQHIKYIDMMIFNRWGEKIYESVNALSEWDGTYKGELQNPGVYTYYVKITFLNDDEVEEKGSVTLIR